MTCCVLRTAECVGMVMQEAGIMAIVASPPSPLSTYVERGSRTRIGSPLSAYAERGTGGEA